MKKCIITIFTLIFVFSVLFMSACVDKNPSPAPGNGRTDEEIYAKIYDGAPKEAYPEMSGAVRYVASYGYALKTEQGYNNWYYMTEKNGELEQAGLVDGRWQSDGAYLDGSVVSPSADADAARRFIAPTDGKVTVNGTFRSAEEKEGNAALTVLLNGERIYPSDGALTVAGSDTVGYWLEFETDLVAGDKLDFVVSGDAAVNFNPSVDYTNTRLDTLYYTTEWGYYGDLHEYYYDDTVYLYHLRNLPDNVWLWYLLQTKDMFRYEEVPIYTTDFVKDHYMAYEQAGDLNDYDTFPAGARDCTKFWDEDIGRYRYIGLSYITNKGNVDCSISMRTSDDETGLLWTQPAVSLRRFPTTADGEPECTHFRKIGNRWYLLTSISRQSIHGVGRLAYWIGGEGQTIDEVDWLNAETHYLDGEDLCAAQVEWVDEKLYLFGWMPQNYAAGYWGGFKNLPREVYVREDGTLGTRLDPVAQSLLNKGRIASANADNVTLSGGTSVEGDKIVMTSSGRATLDGTFDSSYITFDMTLTGDEGGLVMRDGKSKDYKVKILRKSDGVYMQVGEETDPTHPVSSEMRIGDVSETQFEIKVVVEGSIVEFYVNDSWTLSARTSMSQEFSAGVYSRGAATFTGFTVYKLAQLYNIYE